MAQPKPLSGKMGPEKTLLMLMIGVPIIILMAPFYLVYTVLSAYFLLLWNPAGSPLGHPEPGSQSPWQGVRLLAKALLFSILLLPVVLLLAPFYLGYKLVPASTRRKRSVTLAQHHNDKKKMPAKEIVSGVEHHNDDKKKISIFDLALLLPKNENHFIAGCFFRFWLSGHAVFGIKPEEAPTFFLLFVLFNGITALIATISWRSAMGRQAAPKLPSDSWAYSIIRVLYILSPDAFQEHALKLIEIRPEWMRDYGRRRTEVFTFCYLVRWLFKEGMFLAMHPFRLIKREVFKP